MPWQLPKLKGATGKKCKKWTILEKAFKAVVILVVWGVLSTPVPVYFASKDQRTSSDWLDSVSMLFQSLEANCADVQESDYNGTELNGTIELECSSFSSTRQVGVLCDAVKRYGFTVGCICM